MKKIVNNNKIKATVVSPGVGVKPTLFKVDITPKSNDSEYRINAVNYVEVTKAECEKYSIEPHFVASAKTINDVINNYFMSRSFVANVTKSYVNSSGIACFSGSSDTHLNRPAVVSVRPTVSAESLSAILIANNMENYGQCRLCDNTSLLVVNCECSCICVKCLSDRYQYAVDFRPFHCDECAKEYLVNLPNSPVGFHESWYCGHDFSGILPLVKNVLVPTHDHVPPEIISAVGKVAQYTINEVYNCRDGTIKMPNFVDPQQYPYDVPDDSSVGSVYGLSGKTKGETLLQMVSHLVREFGKVKQLIAYKELDQAKLMIDSILPDIYKSAFKVEVAGPKIDGDGNFLPNYHKQRIFYAAAFQLFLICKMLFAGVLNTGSGDQKKNIPTAIGLKVMGCGSMLFSELFNYDFQELSRAVPLARLDHIEQEILDNQYVYHGDFSKYDWRLRHWIMQLHIQLMMRKFDLGTGDEKLFNEMLLSRVCTTLVSKNILDPSTGQPIFVNGLLPSGHYLTALLNSLCNVTMLRSTLMIMFPMKKFTEIIKMVKLKIYGDDWLMVILKKFFDIGSLDVENFSRIMMKVFNMNIPPTDVYQCEKIFMDDHITLKTNVPNFLQHGFIKHQNDDGWHIVFHRPFRPIASAKAFLSSDRALNAKDIVERMKCLALTNGITRYNYDTYKRVYKYFLTHSMLYSADCDYVPMPGFQEESKSNVEDYLTEKFMAAGVDYKDVVEIIQEFPEYDKVENYHLGNVLGYSVRGPTCCWEDYHNNFEKKTSYHAFVRGVIDI